MRNSIPLYSLITAGLFIGCLSVCVSPVFGRADLKSLDDDAIIEQIHRSEYKEEFDRRMDKASPEERTELARKRTKQPRQREFPTAYTDDELVEQATRMDDGNAHSMAVEELRVRYAEADAQKIAVMEGKLRAAFAALGDRKLVEERFSQYSDAEKHRIMREHFEAAAARPPAAPEELSAAELLERLNGAGSIGGWIKPLVALEKQYKDADEQGKRVIQEEYLTAWDRVPLPGPSDQSEGFDRLDLYFVYANNAKKYFQVEAELLAALKSRLLRPEFADGELRMLEALSQPGVPGVLGPLSAKYVDEVLTGLEARRRTPEFMQALPDLIEFSYLILGQCDRDGLTIIEKQGKARHGEGISALRYIDVPEAEAKLWEVYDSFPPTSRSTRVKVLAALMDKQKRAPEEGRLQRIRTEMVKYLVMPKDKFYLSELRNAAQVAGASRDPYYLPYLEKFKAAIESADLTPAVEYRDYPEGFQHNVDGLNQALAEAKESLVKAQAKAQR